MLQSLTKKLQRLNWSIRHKIGLAFILILICFIANGLLSLVMLFNIRDIQQKQDIILGNLEQVERLDQSYKAEINLYSDAIFFSTNKFVRDNFREIITTELAKKGPYEAKSEFETRFAKLYLASFDHFADLSSMLGSGDVSGARLRWQKAAPDFEVVTNLLVDWRKQLEIDRSWWSQQVNNAILLSAATISVITVFSVVFAMVLLILVERVLVRPMKTLQQGLDNVAAGDLNQQIDIYNRDEVGKLADSFKMAVLTLHQVISGVQISESLRSVTGQLAAVSKQQAAGSGEQVSALTQVMAAMQELGSTAGQIAESAVQVAGLTGTTLEQIERVAEAGTNSQEKAHQMVTVVQMTLDGVERVGRQVENFQESMSALNTKTEAIIKVVGLLGSIADEVHLLALNAAIEAAGAGQYGERFRVVAHEIKQLAGRSNKATLEARNIINEVQTSSRIAMAQIEEGQSEVSTVIEANNGLRQSLQELEYSAGQVAEAVSYLLKLAEQVSSRAELIKQATQQQRTSSEMVLVSTRAAEEVARQTASATTQIASSSHQLENLTNQLSGVLNQVKLAV